MRRFLLAAAVFAAPALVANGAQATTTLTGKYSVSEQYSSSSGGPSISDDLSSPFSQNLTLNAETSKMNFFTAAPASYCFGGGCTGNTETDTLTVQFTNLSVGGISIPTLTETATYTAKYNGSELSCAVGDGVSPHSGATDCVVWAGAANTYNGYTVLSDDLGNGGTLKVFLYNATDWNMTPQIGFEIDPATAVPEPTSIALFGTGLVGFGMIRSRKAKQA